MSLSRVAAGAVVLMMLCLPLSGSARSSEDQQAVPRTREAQGPSDYSREDAEFIVDRLYAAFLEREADASGRTTAIGEVQRGRLLAQIEGMARSPEYRQRVAGRTPAEVLEMFYRGLFGRSPDTSGVRTFLADVERGRHPDVVYRIVTSPEFEARLPSRAARPGSGLDAMRMAVPCQEAVLDAVGAKSGRTLLRFDTAELFYVSRAVDGVRGRAFDAFAGDRPLSYRCEVDRARGVITRADYSWDDGQEGVSFPVPVVRACHDAVRDQIRRDRGRRDIIFDTAGILPVGSGVEAIRGRAREAAAFGPGQAIEYACEASRGRITSATYRYGR